MTAPLTTALALLTQHKAKKQSGLTDAEGFWGARLKFCIDWVKSSEDHIEDLEQAVRVYQRAHEIGERERSGAVEPV